jgi:outer membrane protein assembly factor BamB
MNSVKGQTICRAVGILVSVLTSLAVAVYGDWPTHRGNPQRTGHVDGKPGPKTAKVLWTHRSTEHFLAAPAAGKDLIYLSALGALNTSSFRALHAAGSPKERVAWGKSAPYLKLPVASTPAVASGLVIFGDGMHQTSGAVLHCLRADTGMSVWQLPLSGELVHLEGAPTIVDGKVFIGGGNAGVLCADVNRITLEGKELDLAAVKKVLDERWKALLAKYEEEKKKDPDFAVPPTEDSLPKPLPRTVWQQGKDKWHVDAAVNVVDGKVLAASAFLDEERIGERAVYCLNAADGSTLWKAPLKLNPWGGASVAGEVAVIGCSSIRFDTKLIPRAQGEIVALKLTDGKPLWPPRKVTGGVISSVALQGGLAVFTATDGKVRAIGTDNGKLKWTYDAKAAFFAGPAVTGDAVYAADLQGVVHALNLTDGRKLWTLDLASDPAVKAPGMVYGSPIVHDGRLYLATCNVEGERSGKGTVVVCIGD